MSKWPPAHPLAIDPKGPLANFTDAELILLVLVLESGFNIRPHDWSDDEALTQAAKMDLAFRDHLRREVGRREITKHTLAGVLVDRAIAALTAHRTGG